MVLWWGFQYVFKCCKSKVPYTVWLLKQGRGSGQPVSQLKYRNGYLPVNQSGGPLIALPTKLNHSVKLKDFYFPTSSPTAT